MKKARQFTDTEQAELWKCLDELACAEEDFRLIYRRDGWAAVSTAKAFYHQQAAGDRARQCLAALT